MPEFETAKVSYISMQELLNNNDFMKHLSHPEWIEQQAHGLVLREIPRSAIIRIVTQLSRKARNQMRN